MLINYYPKYYILDEIPGKYNSINLFIDLKNCMQPLYMGKNIELLVENTKVEGRIDSRIITDILSFLAFHKIYSIKRNKTINFFLFYETGRSFYHINIYKNYKMTRKIDALNGLERKDRELFTIIIQKNLNLIEKILNYIPNIWVIKLENLEADFIPYYLIRNKLIPDGSNNINIIYSNDHDMFQNLILGNNIFQFIKIKNSKEILRPGEVNKKFLKKDTNIDDEFFPLILSIIGDKSDNISGIPGIGLSRVVDILEDIDINNKISMDEIYTNIYKKNKLGFNLNTQNKIKIDEDIIVRNLKLISFEYLSRYLDDPPKTEFLERKKSIIKKMTEIPKKKASLDAISEALSKSRIILENGNEIDILYHQ